MIFKNRYFAWFFAVAIIAGIALIFYIAISNQNLDAQFVFPSLKREKIYVDKQDGFLQRYPANWQLERDNSGATTFENPSDSSESISIESATANTQKEIKSAFNIVKETDFTRSGDSYSIFLGQEPHSADYINAAVVKSASGKYFYLSGHSAEFNSFVLNFNPF